MARVELPQSKIRARKRRRLRRVAIVLTLFVAVVLGALVAFFDAPFLKITSIVVTGAQTVSADDIKAYVEQKISGDYLFVFPKDDIFLYPQSSLQKELLLRYPEAKSIEVHANNFHTIEVVVRERQPAALWCSTSCYWMDEDGVLYAPAAANAASTSEQYVTYSGAVTGSGFPRQYLTEDKFQALAALVAALSQVESGDPVRQVAIDADGDARAYFQNSFLLMFNIADATGDIFQRLNLALKADPLVGKTFGDLEYIDLRFGDKLYYKLKTQ